MLLLALDTTTRPGSVALVEEGRLLGVRIGDPRRTHAEQLPGEIVALLEADRRSIRDVEAYGVAAGPGSFTGLRIGIATIQGLALVNARPVVPVSALDALARAAREQRPSAAAPWDFVAAWMDAQRRQIFSALYRWTEPAAVEQPAVDAPEVTLNRWRDTVAGRRVLFIGDGALAYAGLIAGALGHDAVVLQSLPPLAPTVAAIAAERAERGEAIPPDAIRPLYIRRPDAELARERAARGRQG